MDRLIFGTAGIPYSTPEHTTIDGMERLKQLKLGCMEMEFVRSIFLTEDSVKAVKEAAKKNNIVLTSHAPYYINLNAREKAKEDASKMRIYQTAKIAHLAGAYSICFHPGFYLNQDPIKVYHNILDNLRQVMDRLSDEGIDIWVRPETMGKPKSFGTLKEILKLSSELKNVMPCIDFAHLHARSNGKENTLEEFKAILSEVEAVLGREGLDNMHIHVSGIEYSDKGEKNHLTLDDSDFNYKDLCKAWKEFKVKGVVISESPSIEDDAIILKRTYENP